MPTFTHLSILTKPALALLGQALLKTPTKQKLTSCQSLLFMQRSHIKTTSKSRISLFYNIRG